MRLKDKVAVITGASQGYGMETARGFAGEGADLAICARGFEKLKKVADSIESETGRKVLPVKCDITVKKEVEGFFETVIKRFKKIDILVNNAGVFPPASILTLTEEDLDKVFSLNLKGTFFCTQAAAKQMVKQRGGKIITIASCQGRLSWTKHWSGSIPMEALVMSPYSCSKGGLIAATRDWAVELAPHGILVNCVAMGVFPSEELKQQFPEEVLEYVRNQTTIKRLGEPKDMVSILVFLASSESDFMTGQSISYDGGWSMP
jgi:NAD(P)-dependent dehydrogenase (short-subunit alcohol dehydrogenase family)